MKVAEKPIATGVGVWFIALAILAAVLLLPGTKASKSPFLYVFILGGLFVGVPAVLGIGVLYENLHKKRRS